ncbi:MAG: hypothetical protein Sylvanvirus8_8 [Sylvanvirus sp.]|uniref:Uncharacterized protein n=1 Tax=Sylvanvirus sp. TaxID=2487774 RepID=A0A3G5AHR2_9VIRU|nr:MAG: hypothetical protein Sylvanvirus8_8 [Sylvanvirus sp.]
MDKFLGFLQTRLEFLVNFQMAATLDDKWEAGMKLFEPCLPTSFKHYGDMNHFPPALQGNECSIIIMNHQSDLDPCLLMYLMHTTFLERQVTPMITMSNPLDASFVKKKGSSYPSHTTLRPIAFTLEAFTKVHVLGPIVTENMIALYKGITDEELQRRINIRLAQGYNTFLLWPEGAIISKTKYKEAKTKWEKKDRDIEEDESSENIEHETQLDNPYPFKNVMTPKSRCWEQLIKCIGPRLRYICDLTFLYSNHIPWEVDWNYDIYPSVVNACKSPLPRVFTHTKIYDLFSLQKKEDMEAKVKGQDKSTSVLERMKNPEELLVLWKQKEKRVEWLRKKEREHQYESRKKK